MQVTDKGQVTIPKPIRDAAGIRPGTEVTFSLEGGRIVLTPVASHVREDRRAELRAAAARVRRSLAPEFRQLGADEIMEFLRGEDSTELAKPRRRRIYGK
jgi:AbrB family looped-hinge helix DNA binding protein